MECKFTEQLHRDGYAIVPNVLTPAECDNLATGFWNFWNTQTDGLIQREDTSTWKNIFKYFPNHGMLFQHWSIGHMQEIWDVRSNPNVKSVFESIWGTTDLTVSFDGASTGLAPEITGRGWHRDDWLHLDQSPHRNEFECVQSWVTAYDVGPGDGTLQLLKGSHLLHREFADHFNLRKDKRYRSDWFKLTQEHVDWYLARGCEKIAIECPAGSMVLWESRTVHAGRSAVRGRPVARNRMVAYVSYMPISKLTPKEARKKQKAIVNGRLTNHWAASRVKLFAKHPRTYGNPMPNPKPYKPPYLSLEGAKLAGWIHNPEQCPLTIQDPEQRLTACQAFAQQDKECLLKRKGNRITDHFSTKRTKK